MKNLKMLYAFICDDVRHELGGKMTYVGQTEVLQVQKFPVIFPKICVVYSCMGEKGKYKVSSRVTEKDSQSIVIQIPEHDIEIISLEQKIREVIQIHNLKIEKPGNYLVEVFYNGELLTDFYFNVALQALTTKNDNTFNIPIIMSSKN
ncbi:MAG: hypothetical protein DKM50_03640 [Candidatus Margulisiibacteriota bacterium]|nr:MAG: hypothetical protein A2X43_07985 [Candidatus Margulisbacteria bacterium GWD2_39_127]OGI03666.1 MAG: hypothetical protein A2X42_06465 [Candidatus Margulisbacteria bacterium GWF2_38_17]PZM82229.1 MAG: hypothetical protein DKM50_03640 [Candidatus Margulisiibacteriota bacterium]HAR63729.1 hypothetical protein [Candidatus Margulisiibacteriota bacterium]HCY35920.1 hypothetical protein [Candidatus Margulisiibacteriota bacterium]